MVGRVTGSRPPAPAEARSSREQAASLLRRVRDAPPGHGSRDEIALAGRLNGLLYLVGGLVALVALVIPGADIDAPVVVVAVAAGAIAWGLGVLRRPPWQRWHGRVSHASSIVGLVLVAVLGPISGGHDSPFEDLVLLVVVSAAFFYTPRHALAYWLGCVVVLGLPLL